MQACQYRHISKKETFRNYIPQKAITPSKIDTFHI